MILRVFALLQRPGRQGIAAWLLPVIAFACVTALLSIVLGGTQTFWGYTDEMAGFYIACAVIAMVLLIAPLLSLGSAAARLQARRRDERLAALRLLGATGGETTALSLLEAALVALTGAILGVAIALAVSPLVGLIHFRGMPLGTASVVLPFWVYPVIVAGVAVVASVSAAIGLRRVVVSPLGVALKQSAPRIPWQPALIAVVAIVLVSVVVPRLGMFGSAAVALAVLGIAFTVTLFAIDVIGVWLTAMRARRRARRAESPAQLLSARAILESPQTAWRQVSGVAMASFMAVFAGSVVAIVGQIAEVESEGAPVPEHMVADIRTGVIIVVIGTFLMVACAVGVNQAALVLDRADIARSLHVMGAELDTQDRARRDAVMQPLMLATVGPAVVAGILLMPLVGGAILFAPLALATVLAALVFGVGIVLATLWATRSLLARTAAV